MIDDTPNILDNTAIYNGRFLNGTAKPTIVIPPEKIAEAPAPATARPIISMVESVAAAHMIDPTSKRASAKQ